MRASSCERNSCGFMGGPFVQKRVIGKYTAWKRHQQEGRELGLPDAALWRSINAARRDTVRSLRLVFISVLVFGFGCRLAGCRRGLRLFRIRFADGVDHFEILFQR